MTHTLREIINEYTAKVPYVGEALAKDRKDLDRYFGVFLGILVYASLVSGLKYQRDQLDHLDQKFQCPPCEQTYGGNRK